MRNLALGVAAVALAVSGASADPGNGKGKGQGGGAEKVMNGPGNGNGKAKQADNGPDRMKPEHTKIAQNQGQGNNQGQAKGQGQAKAKGPGKASGPAMKAAGKSSDNGQGKAKGKPDYRGVADHDQGKSAKTQAVRYENDRDGRYSGRNDDRHGYEIFTRLDDRARNAGLIDGCPPGLAKKHNGCNPPGLVKRDDRRYDSRDWWGLPGLIDGRYRYYDGNLVRLTDAGRISSYYPLLGGALSVGNLWPSWYDSEPLPQYYENYYGLGSNYRYADNTIYRVSPENSAITAIAALLTGDTIRVGQPMPSGYSVYNVPYNYRDRYYDTPDHSYRYSDGYVYDVDPTTQLVASVIDLVV